MENRFYIEAEEEITSIVGKIRKASDRELFLVVPKGAAVAQSLVNLKLLDKEAVRQGKKIVFVSSDPQVRKLAEKAGLLVKSTMSSPGKKAVPEPPAPKQKMSDVGQTAGVAAAGWKLKEELNKAISKVPQKRIIKEKRVVAAEPSQSKKIKVGAFDIASRMPSKAKKPVQSPPPKVEKKKVKVSPPVPKKKIEKPLANPFTVRPIEEDREPVPFEKVPGEYVRDEKREEVQVTMKDREQMEDSRTHNLGVVRGKTVKKKTNLDLVSQGEKKVFGEKPLVEKIGIVETTRRKVGGESKVVDLRSVSQNTFPEIPDVPKAKKKTKKKDIILLPLFNTKLFFIFLFGLAVILAIVGGVIMPTAKVEVKPRTFTTEKEVKAGISEEISEIDWEEKIIPGKSIRFQMKEDRTFTTSSQSEVKQKAKGQVTVYNKASESISLKVNAKLQTASGKKYYTTSPIVVPGAASADVEGTSEPGSFTTEVVAGEAGEGYNLSEGNLTIPGLADTEYEGLVSAKVVSIKGGESRMAKVVSKEDLEGARNSLADSVKEKAKEKLPSYLSSGDKTDFQTLYSENLAFTSSQQEGQEANEFKAEIEIDFFAMSFSENDLKMLSKRIVEADDEKENGKVEIVNFNLSEPKPLENRVELNSNIFYSLQSDVDTDKIKKGVTAKSENEAREYLNNINEIEGYELTIWPEWLKRVPVIDKRIEVKIAK